MYFPLHRPGTVIARSASDAAIHSEAARGLPRYARNDGFSLVELSIVLVILGLLVGGIMTGQNLIRAAELRSVNTQFQNYQTAFRLFQDKYFALPGDMQNATQFWGTLSECGGSDADGTCNGNGDGVLSYWAAGASLPADGFLFWQHMALAGLLEGQFTGLAGSGGANEQVIGENVPPTKLGNGYWVMLHWNNSSATTGNYYAINYKNHLSLTSQLLTPEEAWNLDTKMDDGKPATGNIIATFMKGQCSGADDDTHENDDFVASYELSNSATVCGFKFINSFN